MSQITLERARVELPTKNQRGRKRGRKTKTFSTWGERILTYTLEHLSSNLNVRIPSPTVIKRSCHAIPKHDNQRYSSCWTTHSIPQFQIKSSQCTYNQKSPYDTLVMLPNLALIIANLVECNGFLTMLGSIIMTVFSTPRCPVKPNRLLGIYNCSASITEHVRFRPSVRPTTWAFRHCRWANANTCFGVTWEAARQSRQINFEPPYLGLRLNPGISTPEAMYLQTLRLSTARQRQ